MRRLLLALVVGLLLGGLFGLLLGWIAFPVQLIDSPVQNLADPFKDDYTVMVAMAYQVDKDLKYAENRLRLLGVGNVFTHVRDVAERYISQSVSSEENIRYLVALSCDMGYCTPPMQSFRVGGAP